MDDPGNTSESRIAVESKIAFLERTVDDLNDVILAQGKSLDALEARLVKLEARLHGVQNAEGGEVDPLEESPPHY